MALTPRRLTTLLIAATLAACTDPGAARMAALNQLVGKPEQTLLQAMGVPSRSYETNGTKFLAYSEHRTDIIPGSPGFGFWNVGAIPPQPIDRWCETTFQVTNGKVQSFTLRGNACG